MTLAETVQAQLDAALVNDAALDAAADAANTTRSEQIAVLENLRNAVAAVPEDVLVKAVQAHLEAVAATLVESPEVSGVTTEDAPALEVLIEQVGGDAEEIAEITD